MKLRVNLGGGGDGGGMNSSHTPTKPWVPTEEIFHIAGLKSTKLPLVKPSHIRKWYGVGSQNGKQFLRYFEIVRIGINSGFALYSDLCMQHLPDWLISVGNGDNSILTYNHPYLGQVRSS